MPTPSCDDTAPYDAWLHATEHLEEADTDRDQRRWCDAIKAAETRLAEQADRSIRDALCALIAGNADGANECQDAAERALLRLVSDPPHVPSAPDGLADMSPERRALFDAALPILFERGAHVLGPLLRKHGAKLVSELPDSVLQAVIDGTID